MKKSTVFSIVSSAVATVMVLFLGEVRGAISAHVAKTYEFSYLKLAGAYVAVIFFLLFADLIISRRSAGVHQLVLKPVLAAAILIFFIVNYKALIGLDMYIYVCAVMCLASGAVMGVLEKLGK